MAEPKQSDNFAWAVAGIDSDGRGHWLASGAESEAVELFWALADSHPAHLKVTFYGDERTLWLDENTRLVTMHRWDLRAAKRRLLERKALTHG